MKSEVSIMSTGRKVVSCIFATIAGLCFASGVAVLSKRRG